MTKSGQSSLILDIRFYAGKALASVNCPEADAFGIRLALLLRSQGVSFGSWTHLYIRVFEDGSVREASAFSKGHEWWMHFADVTVPRGFLSLGPSEQEDVLRERAREALIALRPDLDDLIDSACNAAWKHADALKFLVKSKSAAGFRVDVSFNVATWPAKSHLHVDVTNLSNGEVVQAVPIPLQVFNDAWPLVDKIALSSTHIAIGPRASFDAKIRTAKYPSPLVFSRAELRPALAMPPTAGSV